MSNHQTMRGFVSNVRYIEQTGHSVRYTDKPEAASTVTFEVDGHAVTAVNNGFPAISEGDDVEVVGVLNPRGGTEVGQLSNHTTGAEWQFSVWPSARRSFFR